MIEPATIFLKQQQASLKGQKIIRKQTTLKTLKGIFSDTKAFEATDPDTVIYEVEVHDNGLHEGQPGGLFLGISHIYPGKIGQEYYMTRGHLHQKIDTGEYYWGIAGQGLLLLTAPTGETSIHEVVPESLHYIPGKYAHRLINTSNVKLSVGACWLTESGHDYRKNQSLFSKKVVEIAGQQTIQDV